MRFIFKREPQISTLRGKYLFYDVCRGSVGSFGAELVTTETGETQIRGIKGLNELQHQISGHFVGLGLGRDRYPENLLSQIILEKAAAYALSNHPQSSFEFARARNLWNTRVN